MSIYIGCVGSFPLFICSRVFFSVFAVDHCFFFIIRVEENVTCIVACSAVVYILVMSCTMPTWYFSTSFFPFWLYVCVLYVVVSQSPLGYVNGLYFCVYFYFCFCCCFYFSVFVLLFVVVRVVLFVVVGGVVAGYRIVCVVIVV